MNRLIRDISDEEDFRWFDLNNYVGFCPNKGKPNFNPADWRTETLPRVTYYGGSLAYHDRYEIFGHSESYINELVEEMVKDKIPKEEIFSFINYTNLDLNEFISKTYGSSVKWINAAPLFTERLSKKTKVSDVKKEPILVPEKYASLYSPLVSDVVAIEEFIKLRSHEKSVYIQKQKHVRQKLIDNNVISPKSKYPITKSKTLNIEKLVACGLLPFLDLYRCSILLNRRLTYKAAALAIFDDIDCAQSIRETTVRKYAQNINLLLEQLSCQILK